MDEIFTITFQSGTTSIISPEINKKQAIKFIADIGGQQIRKINLNGAMADSETTLSILRAARVFSN